jgi:hypothetical protein
LQYDAEKYRLHVAGRIVRAFLLIGILGAATSGTLLVSDSGRFFSSYLVAFSFWLSISLGSFFFVMLHHLTGARWSIVIRRFAEMLMANLPFLAIFFLPLIPGIREIYHWSHSEAVERDAILAKKASYLNPSFFILRAAGYFLIWSLFARILYRTSLDQDQAFDAKQVIRLRRISAPGMILFALTCTFAAFDWLMSTDAHWYSTIFGVYFFAGSVVAALCALTLIVLYLRRRGILVQEITVEHYHDLGKLIFAFTILWAYMAFSQYFLIWYANIPEETLWFHHRWQGGWKAVSVILPISHFAVPFLVLLSRAAKRDPRVLTFICLWLLFFHWVDLAWLVHPNYPSETRLFRPADITLWLAVGGFFLWFLGKRMSKHAILPIHDPGLQESIHFKNM